MRWMMTMVKAIDRFSVRAGKLCAWLMLSLMFFTCYEVLTRRIFQAPTIWTLEMSTYFFCAVCMLALGYTQQAGGHVNVDILFAGFSPKMKAICNIITFLLFLGIFSAILTIYGGIFAYDAIMIGERSPSAFNALVWPAKLAMPIGAFLLFIQAVSDVLKDVIFLLRGERI